MSEREYTPAPWTVEKSFGGHTVITALEPKQGCTITIARVLVLGDALRLDGTARLIAEAPALAELVREFVRAYDGVRDLVGPPVAARILRAEAVLERIDRRPA